jgi:hypothetical protein
MLAKSLLISGESTREFEDFRTILLEELNAQTKIEEFLAEKIIVCGWRLRRAMIAEKHLLNRQNAITEEERLDQDSFGHGPVRKRIRNISRVDLAQEDARYLAQQQIELQKVANKTIERLRAEQRRNQQRATRL